MLSFLTVHSGVTAADAVVPVALHRPWVHLDSEALVRWSSEIRQDLFWWWAHERLELVSSLGRMSPQLTCGPTLQMSVGLSSQPFSGFRVDPEHIRVSAASVKVVGVTRPVHNHTFSPLLALFFSFPRSQRSQDRGSSPTMEWVAGVCFSSLCAALCDSVKSSARPLGAPVSLVFRSFWIW